MNAIHGPRVCVTSREISFDWCIGAKASFSLASRSIIIIIITIIIIWNRLCKAGREWEHYQSKDPNLKTNPWKEEEDKIGNKKERADHANRKALALLLKPASPTPSNTESLRSFQRHTERGTKVNIDFHKMYCIVFIWWLLLMYLSSNYLAEQFHSSYWKFCGKNSLKA